MIVPLKHIKQKIFLKETDFAYCVTKIKIEFDNKQILQDGGSFEKSGPVGSDAASCRTRTEI